MKKPRSKQFPFDFKSGVVTHNNWAVDDTIPLSKQLWEYGEELVQVVFKKGDLVLDIAWHQQGRKKSGHFVVHLVNEENWENPIAKSTAISLAGLMRVVKRTVDLAERFRK